MSFQPLPPGTQVEWSSQANGSWTTKRGRIICFVPAKEDAIVLAERQGYDPYPLMGQPISAIDRYVVLVEKVGARKTSRKFYVPPANKVRPVEAWEGAVQ